MRALKSNRSATPPRRVGPYTRLLRVWKALLASLILDPCLAFLPHPSIPVESALSGVTACAVFSLLFFDQIRVSRILSQLRRLGATPNQQAARLIQLLLLAIIVVTVGVKLLLIQTLTTRLGIIFTLLAGLAALGALVTSQAQHKERLQKLDALPKLKIAQWETQLVIFSIIPLLLARLLSTIGALSVPEFGATSPLSLSCFITSLILLLGLKPNRAAFVGICVKCKAPIPIAFVDYGSCPQCNQEL